MPFTCAIRYTLAPGKTEEFKTWARKWVVLINKYGGTHHGYFIPPGVGDEVPEATFSFPGLGVAGPPDVALALFTFETVAQYEAYRRDVDGDPECRAAHELFKATNCFLGYERLFLMPLT